MKKMNKRILAILSLVIVMVIVFFATVLTLVYTEDDQGGFIEDVKYTLHLPAASVDGNWISFAEVRDRTAAVRNFYESQDFASAGIRIDFTTENGTKRLKIIEKEVLNKMIEDHVIAGLAEKEGITVSQDEVTMALERAKKASDAEFVQERLGLYGLSEEEFSKYIVYGEILSDKLASNFEQSTPTTEDMRTKIQQAQKELEEGIAFQEVAQKYSEGVTAQEGGALSFFKRGQLTPTVEEVAFSLKKGDTSNVIESPFGLHIIHVDDVTLDASEEVETVSLRQIIVKKENFGQYLDRMMLEADVKIYASSFTWDSALATLAFTDLDLQNFEESILQDADDRTIQ